MNRCTLFAVVALFPNRAFCDGMARIHLNIFDSEWHDALVTRPTAEVAFSQRSAPWMGALSLKLPALRNARGGWDHGIELQEASLSRSESNWGLAAGRLGLRLTPVPLHQGAKSFLRSQPSADGVAFDLLSDTLLLRGFAGGPWVAGFGTAYLNGDMIMSVLYRGERSARAQVPVSRGVGDVGLEARAVHQHDFEVGVTFKGKDLAVVGLFQGRQWHALRFVDQSDERLGQGRVGAIDPALPRSSADYRAVAELAALVFQSEAHEIRGAMALGGRTALRYHVGDFEEVSRRQGGGNELFLSASLEETWKGASAQVGVSLMRANTEKFRVFSQRTDKGSWRLTKYQVGAWTSASFAF